MNKKEKKPQKAAVKKSEKVVDKDFTYDTDFSDKISKGTILNTVNTDISNLSEMIDNVCEILVVFVKIIVMIIVFLKTDIYIGVLVLLLEYLYLKSFDYCNIKSTKYLRGQQKYRDKLTDNLSQILNGLSEIKVFNIFFIESLLLSNYSTILYQIKCNKT